MLQSSASSRQAAAQAARARVSSAVVTPGGGLPAGAVIQVFAHGLNVQPERGHLFYVGGFDRPLSCIGLQIPQGQLERLLRAARIGDAVSIGTRGLSLARAGRPVLRLGWGEPERIDLSFAHVLSPEQLSRAARAIREADPGLSPGLAPGRDLERALRGLQSEGPAQEAAAFWLLGRGLGLTPSGDDILSGFGAGLLAAGERGAFASFSKALESVLARRSTTAVSEAYLSAMLSGSLNEGMLAFFEAAYAGADLGAPLARARDYGHSSGDDMLLGLCTAFER
ncbi:MAG: DUF2877 domain-containing protein [Tractidigestivibacter sp.]|uniref:oxamate carbamoyltransferase subunit AllH family protein n=1 Tax=Tractidigestivibacter sp. TaxID=2847320 RepID=UPI002A80D7E1|nr:DUF2877 domain-containing protein [Tractidigestivibacter sp.]MDY4534046.1 DUF2877 domain-containing protein [Tractidigestivibacter sp.]